MKRLKFLLLSTSIILSVFAAIASKPKFDCTGVPQYYWNGGAFIPAGTFGIDYYCTSVGEACTYYQVTLDTYAVCQFGTYVPLHAGMKEKAAK